MGYHQIAVEQAHIGGARPAAAVAFLCQVSFQTGQTDVGDGHVGLIIYRTHSAQLHQPAFEDFKPQAVVRSGIPFPYLVGNIEIESRPCHSSVVIFQILVSHVDSAVGCHGVGNG